MIANSPDDEIHAHNVRGLSSAAVVHHRGPGLEPDILAKPVEEPVVAT